MADITTQLPTDEQAHEFAVMILSGLPASHAILYFIEEESAEAVAAWAQRWIGSRAVGKAFTALRKMRWQDMTVQQRMDAALERHYNQLSYFMDAHNYVEANAFEKSKLDDARKAIEAKNAGTAGAVGALETFYADLRSGRVKLNTSRVSKSTDTVQ